MYRRIKKYREAIEESELSSFDPAAQWQYMGKEKSYEKLAGVLQSIEEMLPNIPDHYRAQYLIQYAQIQALRLIAMEIGNRK